MAGWCGEFLGMYSPHVLRPYLCLVPDPCFSIQGVCGTVQAIEEDSGTKKFHHILAPTSQPEN